jgi:hypothetical protein
VSTWSRGAALSGDGHYRWSLWRRWTENALSVWSRPLLGWIMLNPSTADADVDDPTIRRCIRFAKRDGYGGIMVANLYGLRVTRPVNLWQADDPVGPLNDAAIQALHVDCTDVVLAWGSQRKAAERVSAVEKVLSGRPVWCLGTTADGHPRHPLYVPAAQPFERYLTIGWWSKTPEEPHA